MFWLKYNHLFDENIIKSINFNIMRTNKNHLNFSKLLDGTAYGRLKVSVFVYLDKKYPENPPENIAEVDRRVAAIYNNPDTTGLVQQWYNLTFRSDLIWARLLINIEDKFSEST